MFRHGQRAALLCLGPSEHRVLRRSRRSGSHRDDRTPPAAICGSGDNSVRSDFGCRHHFHLRTDLCVKRN
jgi:hypothetical protein